jgi:CxxC motif-containing protein
MGCRLSVEEGEKGPDGYPVLSVTGNRCPRGAAYAQEEIRAPKRVVTATCAIIENPGSNAPRRSEGVPLGRAGEEEVIPTARAVNLYAPRRVPVKTAAPCPREKIDALLADIYKTTVKLPVKIGDKILPNWGGLGIDVVAVRGLE